MFIDLSNSTICIDLSPSKLKSYQISQIFSWGFKKDRHSNIYRLSTNIISSLLLRMTTYFDKENIHYTLSPTCQHNLRNINRLIHRFETIKGLGKKYKEGKVDRIKFNDFSSFINNNISRQLKDHQLNAAYHLYLVENGANFSVPGSGKTSVVLSVYEKLRNEGKVNLLFVVGPPSCFGPWKTEFKLTLGRNPDFRVLAGGDLNKRKSEYFISLSQLGELYLSTYQTLLNDQEDVVTFFRQRGIKVYLVIDEAHYIKQTGGNWAKAVLQIAEYAKYRCVLTGTPLPKSYTDVFNQFDFLWTEINPIHDKNKIEIQIKEENNEFELAKGILLKDIGPLFYRVSKNELGLFPPNFHPPIVLKMNKYEKVLYDAIEKRIRNLSKEDYLKNIDLVNKLRRGRITRLRQCVSYAKLLLTAVENYDEDIIENTSDLARIIYDYDMLEIPSKLYHLIKFITKLHNKNEKVVIWANFIGTLKLIKNQLTEKGFYCKLIYGEVPTEQTAMNDEETREKIRDEFVDPRSGLNILIANPAACSESISLHKTCKHSIYYDLSYNCAQYLQSLDRIHRVGGSENKQANYHFLQYENTIDQDIKNNLELKANKMYDLIESDYNIYSLDMFGEDDDVSAYKRLFYGNDD